MTYSVICETGGREKNEDSASYVKLENNYCFVVADGLGAHGNGDIASRIMTEAFTREFCTVRENSGAFIKRAFDIAQAEIMSSKQGANDMKTTGAALAIIDGRFSWGHIGDTRLYFFHKSKFRERTLDHSVPQMLALTGEINDGDIARHPDRSKLLRAMGDKWEKPGYELSKERKLSRGDAFLICTDGFWENISNAAIAQTQKSSANAEEWLAAMLLAVETEGKGSKMDNYSAIAIKT